MASLCWAQRIVFRILLASPIEHDLLKNKKNLSSKFPRWADQTSLDVSARKKSFFSITCRRRHFEIILRCLSSIEASRLELKNYIFGSTRNNSLIQTVKRSLSKGKKNFVVNFHDASITPLRRFSKVKLCFFHAPFWNDCEMFIVFYSTVQNKQ